MSFYQNDPSGATWVIQRASVHELLINGVGYTHSIILTEQALSPWSVSSVDDITPELLQPLTHGVPELVILGTGPTMHLLHPQLLQIFYQLSIGVEMMDTPAAARTYNLLAQEGRSVNAGFIVS